jgi:hypothetical protein
MKIRKSFVSNSSSTSLCILGVPTNLEEMIRILFNGKKEKAIVKKSGCVHVFDRNACNFCPKCGKKTYEILDDGTVGWGDVSDELNEMNLSHYETDDGNFVGVEITGCTVDQIANSKEINDVRQMFGQEPKVISGEFYA